MTNIQSERLTVARKEGFVVFLIGARFSKWWMLPVVWGTARAMGRMLKELTSDPDSGLLSFESYTGRTTMMVQYWRSVEDLQRFAKDRQRTHVPAWQRWVRQWGATGAVGIWHETYVVSPGTYEVVYHQMPPIGLGRIGPLVPATGSLRSAASRLAKGASQSAPA